MREGNPNVLVLFCIIVEPGAGRVALRSGRQGTRVAWRLCRMPSVRGRRGGAVMEKNVHKSLVCRVVVQNISDGKQRILAESCKWGEHHQPEAAAKRESLDALRFVSSIWHMPSRSPSPPDSRTRRWASSCSKLTTPSRRTHDRFSCPSASGSTHGVSCDSSMVLLTVSLQCRSSDQTEKRVQDGARAGRKEERLADGVFGGVEDCRAPGVGSEADAG